MLGLSSLVLMMVYYAWLVLYIHPSCCHLLANNNLYAALMDGVLFVAWSMDGWIVSDGLDDDDDYVELAGKLPLRFHSNLPSWRMSKSDASATAGVLFII
jgi:hypothetical protein